MTKINIHSKKRAQGVSMIETLIALPIVLLLGAGIIHIGLTYQAKSNLEYAALMAARVGASTSLDIEQMRREVKRRMKAADQGNGDLNSLQGVEVEVLNPDISVFYDWGGPSSDGVPCPAGFGDSCEIPNDNLLARNNNTNPADGSSGLNIKEANLLRIRVTYYYDTSVPFMNGFFLSRPYDPAGGVPSGTQLVAHATVRMQSPARITDENICCISNP